MTPRRGMPAAVHSSAAALIWVLLAVGTGSSGQTPGQPGDVPMRVLSSAPQYVSGGDVRIEVRAASVEQPLQRRPGNGLSAVRGNRAHLGTDTSGLEDGGHVLDDDRAKCAMQVGRGIAIAAARGNAIAEDLARSLAQCVSRFVGASCVDAAKCLQQEWRRDL